VAFYKAALGLHDAGGEGGTIGLAGDDFTLWVTERGAGTVLQELVPEEPDGFREHLLAQGFRLLDLDGRSDTEVGYFVEDPYGLRFHVYTGRGGVRLETFPDETAHDDHEPG
jgi:hypothetical protein